MKNFLLRSLTGFIYAVLVITGIIVNSYTFLVLFSLVVILCLYEFYGLINASKRASVNPYFNCFGGLLLFVSSYFFVSETTGKFIFVPYLIYLVIVLVSGLYRKCRDPLANLAYAFLGQCYVALPLSVLSLLAFHTDGSGIVRYYPVLVLSLFVFIWVNDTGAYLVGITIGKHRLFERISPKKSWEGFWGGLVFTILSSLAFSYYEPHIPYYHWIGIAVMVVVFGTWGDLVESLMKRTLDVKDSGCSLPGHGGFLDRFDSLLLAVYGIFFYVQLFIQN
ncbi:phosphatidate cytidylyltransferase [Bacteroidia bacterium]|nr:phosphatidate cytidylyltransferase [Bacteroidia bacterium]GHU90132.1 phosphatidate cytidylyltransferase [Bacteroidia bacterium]